MNTAGQNTAVLNPWQFSVMEMRCFQSITVTGAVAVLQQAESKILISGTPVISFFLNNPFLKSNFPGPKKSFDYQLPLFEPDKAIFHLSDFNLYSKCLLTIL